MKRALISVSDKTGIEAFARMLANQGVEILSTGGTAKLLRDHGIDVTDVADHTGFPEMLDGRVKTLHPKIHGGLLGRRDLSDHVDAMREHEIAPIDILVVNLYPFEATVAKAAPFEEVIENIDIGGPAMIRSAAKNHNDVLVIVDPEDYERVGQALTSGDVPATLQRDLAMTAFARTAAYDSAISRWFADEIGESLPKRISIGGARNELLRYGENPHQKAAFYRDPIDLRPGVADAEQLQGKALSYNNLNDADAAFALVSDLDREKPGIAIIKHANPCGVAQADDLTTAYRRALACDPVSAFGGIIACNRALDGATAELIAEIFTEVVIAPGISDEARAIFAKKKNLRLLNASALLPEEGKALAVRSIAGGLLIQTEDNARVRRADMRVVTKRAPTETEWRDLEFAFLVAKHVKSNAIVYAREQMTVGIGAGQMNRKDSALIGRMRGEEVKSETGISGEMIKNSVVASDAFFPFADGLIQAAEVATAVVQPGGSMRDQEVIDAADERNLAMVFTDVRHFRH
ncbi:MAG: bifunctional phosphoribosylaminoimidazolecarboxamide formyltransferase/IMP cyclohydrolase [Pseudomonadota bacterium]